MVPKVNQVLFLFTVIIFSLLANSCQVEGVYKEQFVEFELTNWSFREWGKSVWLPATVPGTVHTDLMANGIIEDPYYRTNEKDLQWIDKRDWEYRTTFEVEKDVMDKKEVQLIFNGLDTYATVFLNGDEILKADNMFRSWKVDVKNYFALGENTLRIVLHSPTKTGLKKLEVNGYPLPASNDQSKNGEMGDKKVSIFTRKAGYHFGWDWGPRLVTSGIWRPVKIEAYNHFKIEDIHLVQKDISIKKAKCEAVVDVVSSNDQEIQLELCIDGNRIAKKQVQAKTGISKHHLYFEIENPALWWPNGLGDQHLYHVELSVSSSEHKVEDKQNFRLGLRTIKLIQEPDNEGKSFYFKVNGKPVFAKGANYIPNDVFLPRVKPSDYERIIKDAAEANMNMLRVWGGGIYENDIFYDLCDQYGIMVWQDFMYACSMYPGDDDFLNNARLEAEDNIKRLRNHPSLVLWCGNNEIEVAWGEYEDGRGWGWKERYNDGQRKQIWHNYDTLFHHILPDAVEKFNPQTDYWHSSPSASMGKLASHKNTSGDMHYWGVWHGQEPFSDFRKYRARFMSEYGFQSFPELNTVKTYALPEERDIKSEVMAHHQRSGIGNLRIRQYMEKDYKIPDDFEHFLYVSQLLQAEGIKMAIESHRAEKPYCMGTLYWQLNDCWPVASWSGIDYYGRWKALHHFVKKAYQETLLASFQDETNIDIWLLSDASGKTQYNVELIIIDFEGNQLWKKNTNIYSNPDSAVMINRLTIDEIKQIGDLNCMVLIASILQNEQTIDTELHFFTKPKDLKLEEPELDLEIVVTGNQFEITLKSSRLAKNVFLSTDISTDHFSDNYFDLLPGKPVKMFFPMIGNLEDFKKSIKVIHLFETY